MPPIAMLTDTHAHIHGEETDTYRSMRAVGSACGAERSVWESGFPCELWIPKASYSQHLYLFSHALGLTRTAVETILVRTPGRLWFGHH